MTGIGVGVGLYLGGGSEQEAQAETTPGPAAAKPTWDTTAQPVPNEYGSYGQNQPADVARSFVIEALSWSPDEPMPDSWLARIRPTTTDEMFASMMDEGVEVVQWDVDEGVVGRTINVTDVLNEIGDVTKLTVKYQVTDIMADGTERTSGETEWIAIGLEVVDVQLEEGSGTKTIQEYRVADAGPGRAWGAEEEE
ncbi:MAG: hypothetical protein L0G46_02005 [Kocuria sp.]|nr:hypothetical protein [Kocuria sp.]